MQCEMDLCSSISHLLAKGYENCSLVGSLHKLVVMTFLLFVWIAITGKQAGLDPHNFDFAYI
jgi:low temperature requirement protein LtrA